MNLEDLKTAWQEYDQKLSVSQQLNEQLIISMLKERSRSRIDKIRKESMLLLAWMFIILLFIAALFAGNPFDFTATWQYIPYGILGTGVLMGIFSLFQTIKSFEVDLNSISLKTFLSKTIDGYEKNKKMERWFGILMFTAGALTVFSFLPGKLQHKALLPALGETALMLGVTLLMYFIAYQTGVFKNRKKEGFENDLTELNNLKSISAELGEV